MASSPAAGLQSRSRRQAAAASVPDEWDVDEEPATMQPAGPSAFGPATAAPDRPAAAPTAARDSQTWAEAWPAVGSTSSAPLARPGGTWQQQERRLWHDANASAPAAAPIVARVLPPLGAPSLSDSAPPPRILARPPRNAAESAPAPVAPAKSRAQREEEYAQARARIFGPDSSSPNDARPAASSRPKNSRRGDRRAKPPDLA
ncbi:hypothetical protein FA09DRAFT_332835 [Tilletiopsis washingtonensis]|uniref:SUZ domain-containing protein n=1 Tax=Tilletiopsis washingtonensis TaxID=58919 RepID=A0A316Z2X2_9BASI|nr:hypothetical protein FA09DRAFT_332835 [Tilletiopsis washingtonensis]PWN94533.1 hypothetical protein FA09DRAFT_332835 [Tilletiopsis washingtonensis]